MVLLWGVVIALIAGGAALLVRQASGFSSADSRGKPDARQILDERLARGEISRDEYDELRARLG